MLKLFKIQIFFLKIILFHEILHSYNNLILSNESVFQRSQTPIYTLFKRKLDKKFLKIYTSHSFPWFPMWFQTHIEMTKTFHLNYHVWINDTPSKSLINSNANSKMKTMEGKGVGIRSLVCNTLRVEGCARTTGWGLRWITSKSIIHIDLHKPNNKLVNV
jgi:hypothetical protein